MLLPNISSFHRDPVRKRPPPSAPSPPVPPPTLPPCRLQHVSPAVAINGHQSVARFDINVLPRLQAVQALEEVAPRGGVILQHRGLGAQGAGEEGEEVQPCHLHSLLPLLAVLLQTIAVPVGLCTVVGRIQLRQREMRNAIQHHFNR